MTSACHRGGRARLYWAPCLAWPGRSHVTVGRGDPVALASVQPCRALPPGRGAERRPARAPIDAGARHRAVGAAGHAVRAPHDPHGAGRVTGASGARLDELTPRCSATSPCASPTSSPPTAIGRAAVRPRRGGDRRGAVRQRPRWHRVGDGPRRQLGAGRASAGHSARAADARGRDGGRGPRAGALGAARRRGDALRAALAPEHRRGAGGRPATGRSGGAAGGPRARHRRGRVGPILRPARAISARTLPARPRRRRSGRPRVLCPRSAPSLHRADRRVDDRPAGGGGGRGARVGGIARERGPRAPDPVVQLLRRLESVRRPGGGQSRPGRELPE